ncbi:MAG TPA: helix-turn-helix domain-containing protein [Flavisolibacter sp.]|jgi:transcriptional regulator GlxA family with amidase domain|nr:helix-turn-helix domain-containing protein [Flavisolibacter sp.]
MKHISILVPEGEGSLVNIEGTHQIFSEVNSLLARVGKPPLFKVQLVGINREASMKKGLFRIHPDVLIGDVTETDLIIIPAIQGEKAKVIKDNEAFLPWIVQQYKGGAAVATLCIGVFLLAATGLLKGKRCATHWAEADNFRRMFPDVDLVPEKIITDEGGIYTSGGAYSWLNLILYIVEKMAGRDIAITCSKIFGIQIERNSQSAFMIFHPQKRHEDEAVMKAQEFIETNYAEKISVDDLAKEVGVSRRNLERRFRKVTYNSIVEYMQRVRIEAAKQTLERERENVNEAMYKAGYSDSKAFRTTFKKLTGLSPMAYRNKYVRKEALAEA